MAGRVRPRRIRPQRRRVCSHCCSRCCSLGGGVTGSRSNWKLHRAFMLLSLSIDSWGRTSNFCGQAGGGHRTGWALGSILNWEPFALILQRNPPRGRYKASTHAGGSGVGAQAPPDTPHYPGPRTFRDHPPYRRAPAAPGYRPPPQFSSVPGSARPSRGRPATRWAQGADTHKGVGRPRRPPTRPDGPPPTF